MKLMVAHGSDRSRNHLVSLLSSDGYDVQSTSTGAFVESLAADSLPDLIVCDESLRDAGGTEIIRRLRATPVGKQVPVLALVGARSRMDQLRMALDSGANDAVYHRARDFEISARVRGLLTGHSSTQGEKVRAANTITVVGARGGSGKTVLACNLAVAIARYSGETVALLDLNLEFGTTHTMLGLQPVATLSEIAHAAADDTSDEDFDAMLLHHGSGVRLLPAVAEPGDSELLRDEAVVALLTRLRRTYDHLIIDGRPSYREFMIDLWDASDSLVVPCPADVASVSVTRALLQAFSRVGVGDEKIMVVVNNVMARSGLSAAQIERFLARPTFSIPYDGDAMQAAVNTGRPYILDHPNQPTGLAIRNLADQLLSLYSTATRPTRLADTA